MVDTFGETFAPLTQGKDLRNRLLPDRFVLLGTQGLLDALGLGLRGVVSLAGAEGGAELVDVGVAGTVPGSLEVGVEGSVEEIVLVLLSADLAVVGVGGGPHEYGGVFVVFGVGLKFKVSLKFFFELKSLEGLILEVVLLEGRGRSTWSAGRKKEGVKNSRSWLKVGIRLFAIPGDLAH